MTGKISGKFLYEIRVSGCKRIGIHMTPVNERDLVEAVLIHPYPRQVTETEVLEKGMQGLPLIQSSGIMEACVEGMDPSVGAFADESLETASDLTVLFQNSHLEAVACQYDATLQTAKTASDYYDTLP